MHALRLISEVLTALLGIGALAWLAAETWMRALDSIAKVFHVQRYFHQFVYERHWKHCREREAAAEAPLDELPPVPNAPRPD
jgi:uncharacterized protein with von Willebrand factor type A (vWA) domain